MPPCGGRSCCNLVSPFFSGSLAVGVQSGMLTLFMAITNGLSWDDALRPLRNVSYVAVALVVCYVTLAVFAILNASLAEQVCVSAG